MSDRIDEELLNESETRELATEQESGSGYYGKPREVIARYNHCAICGSNLHFTHSTDFSRNLTQETAKCPECGVKVRSVLHRLQ